MRRAAGIVGILSLGIALNSYGNDSDRIDLLEKEIRDLKIRVLKLEAPLDIPSTRQESPPVVEGWKTVANWRKLTTKMGPNEVRKILGEPQRLDGGAVATWHYQNGGRVTFISDKAFSWEEPNE